MLDQQKLVMQVSLGTLKAIALFESVCSLFEQSFVGSLTELCSHSTDSQGELILGMRSPIC